VVVVREAEYRVVLEVLNQLVSGAGGVGLAFSLVQILDSEDWGTADSLRHLRGKLKPQHSDVLVVSCDLVTTVPLHLLTEFHSCHHSTLTCLLSQPPQLQEDAQRKANSTAECDIIGLTSGQQLVYFSAQADLDDCLALSKAFLKRHPHMRISSRLTDAHLYLMRRWVLDYLADNKSISSVKGELVPHLVRHQWMQASSDGRNGAGSANKQALQLHASSCVDVTEQLALQLSSFAGYSGHSEALTVPLLACHALEVCDQLCLRVNSITSYMDVNRLLSHHSTDFQTTPQPSQRPKGVGGDCALGDGVQLGEKVSVKHSAVGNHCHIGDRSKVTNSVLMDHVSIGEGVTVQGCVVCSHVHVEDRASLKDCLVGANFTVAREADIKGETLVAGGGLHF
jgi:translation initiation factor eIF-2B subunit gamma